jgi:hypothetical protein
MNIGTFIGSWNIQYKSEGAGGPVQNGWTLMIGTDTDPENPNPFGDTSPFLDEEYVVCVGFALIDPNNGDPKVVISTRDYEGEQPAVLSLVGEQLQWMGYYAGERASIYISAAQTPTVNGQSIHLYGSTTFGDPEQVAVWGGSGTPPPPPSPEPGP